MTGLPIGTKHHKTFNIKLSNYICELRYQKLNVYLKVIFKQK